MIVRTTAAASAGVGDVDLDATTIELLLVHACDGTLSFGLAAVSDEAEATRATGAAVTHDDGLHNDRISVKPCLQNERMGLRAEGEQGAYVMHGAKLRESLSYKSKIEHQDTRRYAKITLTSRRVSSVVFQLKLLITRETSQFARTRPLWAAAHAHGTITAQYNYD
jgi:hypothetical protein